jgi:phosphatidylinositol alpha-1,6-mannosyltransferase
MPAMKQPTQLLLIGPFSPVPTRTERLLHWLPTRLRTLLELALGFPTDEVRLRSLLLQNPNVKHLGRIPFEDVVQLFRAAHAFVMPNIKVFGDMEGFGLVCLEASICGIPVLAANIDGIPSAIHDQQNGILLPSANADAWSLALDHLIDHFPEFKQRALTWQSYTIEHFGWGQMVKNYFAHFAQLQSTP